MAGSPNQFVHLHVHSQYSLLDGACRIGDMVKRAKDLNQPALAITDHGSLSGIIDFYNQAKTVGVKPILGIEAYMAPGSRHDRTTTGVKDGGYHLLLLASDHQGYRNLLKLSSIAYTEGFYYKPRIDKETLKAYSAGLIATSACLGGEIPMALMQDNRKKARELAELYISIFGADRFFIEVQKHIVEQDKVNPELMDLAQKLGVGCVATNDVHFLLAEDHAPHDCLCCISTGRLISDESRMKYPTQLYLKSSAEMYAAQDHRQWTEACENSVRIAEMCNVELNFKQSFAPVVKIEKDGGRGKGQGAREEGGEARGSSSSLAPNPLPLAPIPGTTEWFNAFCARYRLQPFDDLRDKDLTPADVKRHCDDALRELSEAGLIWRYGNNVTPEHRARMERELKVLSDKNIAAYFLIVWDFVSEARRRAIPALARGSGVGTMVGYCLGLSNACPVQYGLLFERFTDPDRSEYPDIDVDICQDGRQEIIDYVRQKYGHVAQIITFGTLKARAAIRDVGRVLNVPLSEVDKLCKLVGDGLGMTIKHALEQEPDLRKTYDDNPTHRKLIDTAQRLEGLARHAGVHAAGVVIATQPLDNIIPLYRPSNATTADQLVTQWDGPTVEKMGLLKMDFLGLRTLSIIEKAKALIRATLSPETIRATFGAAHLSGPPQADPLDLDRLTYDDQNVLDLFRRGETAGVFQFESGGMRNLLLAMKPDRLEDLIAANALFRPGPMDLIPEYCDRKHGRKPVPKVHAIVDKHTADTYGVMVYQEQVMQIVHGLGSIPLRAAYTLIKNISKKKQKDIDAVRPTFVEGAQKQGLTEQKAQELFELILKFAGYGFNKSHSTGYAIVAYQTAYLKTYFPIQYMAAVLTYESVDIAKVVQYMDECKRVLFPDPKRPRGIDVKPPDINLSEVGFTVIYEKDEVRDANHGHIRFGLSAVKGVGDKAIRAMIDARTNAADGKPLPPDKVGFKSLYDFCERVPPGVINKATVEALIKCGAFDTIHGKENRAAMVEAIDAAIQAGQRIAADRSAGQMSFFDSMPPEDVQPQTGSTTVTLPKVRPWTTKEMLDFEKSVLGFYASAHPLDEHRDTVERFSSATTAQARRLAADAQVVLGGSLTRIRATFVKNGRSAGQKMAMVTLEDKTGTLDGVIFSDAYATYAPLIEADRIVFIKGKIDRRREEPNIVIDQVIPVEQAAQLAQGVKIILRDPQEVDSNGLPLNGELTNLKTLLQQAAAYRNGVAAVPVFLEVHQQNTVTRLRLNNPRVVGVTADLPARIAAVLHAPAGTVCCELIGPTKQSGGAAAPLHREDAPQQDRLVRAPASEEEFCESIDRY